MSLLPLIRHAWFNVYGSTTSPPPKCFLFPETDRYLNSTFESFFSIIYTSLPTRQIANQSRVRKIIHLKETTGLEHELLLVDIICDPPNGDHATYIQIDGWGLIGPRPWLFRPSQASRLRSTIIPKTKIGDMGFLPDQKWRAVYPFDAYVAMLCRTGYQCLRTVTLPKFTSAHSEPRTMSTLQFLVMARALHHERPDHTTVDDQYYWYAGTLLDLIAAEFGGTIHERPSDFRSRAWKFVKVTDMDPAVIVDVLDEYRVAWKSLCDAQVREAEEREELLRAQALLPALEQFSRNLSKEIEERDRKIEELRRELDEVRRVGEEVAAVQSHQTVQT